MGKNQSKALSSLVSTLGLSSGGGDERTKGPRRKTVTFQTHSNSLDSITTAVSFGTDNQSLSHSNSMDNLLHRHSKPNPAHPTQSSFRRRKESGGKVYDALMETSSIVTAFSDAVVENNGARDFVDSPSGARHHEIRTGPAFSHTSAKVHRSSSPQVIDSAGSGRGQEDAFSDKFVLDCDSVEVADANVHTEDQMSHLRDQLSSPHLHPAIINKLSHEEWQELISYACATLSQTLLAAILEEIRKNHLLLQTRPDSTANDCAPPTSNERAGQERPRSGVSQTDLGDMCTQSIEDLLRKLREHRNRGGARRHSDETKKDDIVFERTASLPPLNLKQPLSGRHSAPMESHRQEQGAEEREEFGMHVRSKSHGESDYRHSRGRARLMNVSLGEESCNAEADLDLNHHGSKQRVKRADRRCGQRCTCENKNHLSHGSGGKRKRGRSRSDGHRDSTLVDPSLDDDCPGVPENRIRRPPRYHQHQHQHHVCRQCLTAGDVSGTCNRARGAGPAGASKKGGWGRRYSPDLEHVSARRLRGNDPSPPSPPPAAGGPALVMTLEDVRTATLLLEKSTEFVEYESEDEGNQVGGNHSDSQVKVVSHSSNEEVRGHSQATVHNVEFSRNVPYGRSGRDSPATDMAVACLDLNSAKMLQPIHVSGSMEAIFTGVSNDPADMVRGHQLYLHNHNHHHYHHIIHHHSQP